jgi:hypothetical protein
MLGWRLLGVRDTAAGGHQVQLAGPDHLLTAEAVPVKHVPREQPCDRLQPDVRTRRHLHPGRAIDGRRTVVVDEAPRAYAAAQPQWQHPAHGDFADLRLPRRGNFKIHCGNGVTGDLHVRIDCAHRPIVASGAVPGR